MCAVCQAKERLVELEGEILCGSCGAAREWSAVIEMVQRQLEPAGVPVAKAAADPLEVAADPFSRV
jgi:hypothetical protein